MKAAALAVKRSVSKTPDPLMSAHARMWQGHAADVRQVLHHPVIQPKLAIGEPNDKYEQEADRVADAVMRMPEPAEERQLGTTSSTGEQIQRMCPECEEELHRKPVNEELLQTKAVPGHTPDRAPGVASAIQTVGRGGSPLPESARQFFEPRFARDFSAVRVHSDEASAASAHAIGARAYTLGQHIVFGRGEWVPGTDTGRELLAHELVHVVQQTPDAVARKTELCVQRSRPKAIPLRPEESNANSGTRTSTELPDLTMRQSLQPTIQRDLAIEPPHPEAAGRVLAVGEMTAAIAFNNRVLGPGGADLVREIRDVLGTSPDPAVVDEDFVNAVVTWQAMQGLTQDGQLGPRTAAPLFREIGAEEAGECKVRNGVVYAPGAPAAVAGGLGETTHFAFNAEFESDPAAGVFPSCCQVRQFIRWNAAAAAGMGPAAVPHGGFPAGTPVDRFIEDRDAANHRFGHRSGPFADPQPFDQYLDSTGARNQAFGNLYRATDDPSVPPAMAVGQWQFYAKIIDVCRGGVRKGDDSLIRINW